MEVYWALSNETSKALVQNYFPQAKIISSPAYNITYAQKSQFFFSKLLMQSPKILKVIKTENQWLKAQQKLHHFDLILSDNRYGMYHLEVPSIFIGHQIYLRSGKQDWMDTLATQIQKKYLKRFDDIWKLDDPTLKIAGELAWRRKDDYPSIGVTSQFMSLIDKEVVSISTNSTSKKNLLFVLSGPEPQRQLLETAIRNEVQHLTDYHLILIRGTLAPYSDETDAFFDEIVDLSKGKELLKYIQDAELVISRSGYSTLMDLIYLQKKMLLIPTPGQTEQIYLAEYFQEQTWAIQTSQENLNLSTSIELALALSPPIIKVSYSEKHFIKLLNRKLESTKGAL